MENTIGSIWHKWDLHYHTPASYDYKKPHKATAELVKELVDDGINAVVITDHHVVDFEKINEFKKEATDKLSIFRGIELTSDLGGSEFVHFICIFPDNILDHKINYGFLAKLGLAPEEMKIKSKEQKELIYVSYKDVLEYGNALGCLIGVHAGNKTNSIENIKNWLQAKQKQKEDILKSIHYLETGNKNDIEEYDSIVFPSIKRVLPIIVGSDYHSEFSYGYYLKTNKDKSTTKEKRDTTWIKSDLTFTGLKQMIYEPKLRVKVQTSCPYEDKYCLRLENIKIENSKMFKDDKISINQDMIAVIGEKGSGKTALLDMIALIFGEKNNSANSFLLRAAKEIFNAKIRTKNYGLDEIVYGSDGAKALRCKYINPQFLATICEKDDEMQTYIKEILQNKSIEEKEVECKDSLVEIAKINQQIINNNISLNSIVEINDSIIVVVEKINEHKKAKPEVTTIDSKMLEDFEKADKAFQETQEGYENVNRKHCNIQHFINTYRAYLDDQTKRIINEIDNQIKISDFDMSKIDVNINIAEKSEQHLKNYAEEINNNKIKAENDVIRNKAIYEDLKNKIYSNKEQQIRFDKWKTLLSDLENSFKNQTEKYNSLDLIRESNYKLREKSKLLFANIINNKKYLLKTYKEMQSRLLTHIGNLGESKITFIPMSVINKQLIYSELECVLSSKSIDFDKVNSNLNEKYEKLINKLLENDFTDNDINDLIELFISEDEKKNIFGKKIINKIIKQKYSNEDLFRIALLDSINIKYEIKFNGITMEQLSSGQKGIVLMKLLLRLDQTNDPLLIDQPEDNLDNKSVYEELVDEFKNIKQHRQLIIATHNPNLVVNSDAEQIIIAKYIKNKDGYISYKSGALENTEIRNEVCRILEGGKDAFINREKKYGFKEDNV